MSEVRGSGLGARLQRHRNGREEPLHLKARAAAGNISTFKQRWLCWHRRDLEELSNIEGQEGGNEEIPFIQGKEQ